MILLVNAKSGAHIYTYGLIRSRKGPYLYVVEDGNTSIEIFTKARVDIGMWVRFYGLCEGRTVDCEFIAPLNGVNIDVLRKCISAKTGSLS